MFRNSVTVQTIIDIFVIATAVILSITVFRLRGLTPGRASALGSGITILGLALLGGFYLSDLVAMFMLPVLWGDAAAQTIWNFLHLNIKWVVIAAATSLICIGTVLTAMDRRRAHTLLRTSEERYRSVVQDQLDMIVRWRPDGVRTWANEPYCRNYGLTPDEAIGSSVYDSITDPSLLQDLANKLTPKVPVHTSHIDANLPDGSTSWQEWVSRGLFDESGNLIEIQSICRDVTGRIRTARALQESESRFRGFVENTPDLVWEADRDLNCIYSNQQSSQLYGYEPAEMQHRSLFDFVHPDVVEKVREEFSQRRANNTGWRSALLKLQHRNGSIRFVESSADPIFDVNGEIVGYRGIDRDRTFQHLLTQLSLDLLGCRANEVYEKVDASLERIAQCYELDRLSIWYLKSEFVLCEHEWVRDHAMQNRVQAAYRNDMPLANATIFEAGESFKVESLRQLSAESADRQFLESHGVKSVMALPLFSEGSVIAFGVCTTVSRERTWPDDTETELRLLLNKIIDARMQADSTLAILRRERDLSQSEELAQVGSYAFYPGFRSRNFPDGWESNFSAEQCILLETTPEDASIELFLSRIHEDDRPRIESALNALVNKGEKFAQEFRFVTSNERLIHVSGSAERETDHYGNLSRIVGSCRDITEQINREEALFNALRENESLRERLEEENVQLREEIRSTTEFKQIIGDSNALRASLNLAAKAAPTDATILILGETGTGKELVAKAIHQLSNRSSAPLVSINCTALPANLIESELFGHEKGAFTGASSKRAGRFEIADGGTLFLDEIGDLPVELQTKLLRVLEDGGFERLGGNTTIRPDVRLITATNRNLEQAVREGRFRADLYYRINTVPVELPPLRDRKEDIPMLAQHFVDKHRERLGKSVIAISSRMIDFLLNREWPGNVRELEHYIERSLISATGKVLSIGEQPIVFNTGSLPGLQPGRPTELKSVEREHILQILNDTGWVIDGNHGAAAILGLAPSTLRSRMKRLGISRRL